MTTLTEREARWAELTDRTGWAVEQLIYENADLYRVVCAYLDQDGDGGYYGPFATYQDAQAAASLAVVNAASYQAKWETLAKVHGLEGIAVPKLSRVTIERTHLAWSKVEVTWA